MQNKRLPLLSLMVGLLALGLALGLSFTQTPQWFVAKVIVALLFGPLALSLSLAMLIKKRPQHGFWWMGMLSGGLATGLLVFLQFAPARWLAGWNVVDCRQVTADGSYFDAETMAAETCAVQAFQNGQAFVAETCYIRADSGPCRGIVGNNLGLIFFGRGGLDLFGYSPPSGWAICTKPKVRFTSAGDVLICPTFPFAEHDSFFIPWLN